MGAMRPSATSAPVRAVLLDFGDTLVDESTERKTGGVTISAELLPGARWALAALRERHALGLVADGRHRSYLNVLGDAGVLGWFATVVSSEAAGAEKPAAAPFERALAKLAVPATEAVMVGNRLDRDVAGAQALGLRTVWLRWSPRYPTRRAAGDPVPDATIASLRELPAAVARLGR
jgi:FMN phosphatase YigB (HAD superfamily)